MAWTKLQSGDYLVAGTCTEPDYRLVGANLTPRCRCGILAAQSDELDAQGRPKAIFMNVVAWRGHAEMLRAAHKGDSVLAIGKLHTREYEGKEYKDIQVAFIIVVPASSPLPATGANEPTAMHDDELPF